jgi:8-oxo-dGTP pyrophosphatase MutT (NUDIX family)
MNSNILRIKVVLIAFIDPQGSVMLNRRADAESEMWELIGGGIESGESPHEAICREVNEEVGYMLDDERDNLKLVKEFNYENNKFFAEVFCFKAKYPGKNLFTDSDETFVSDLEMFSLEDMKNLTLLPMTKIFFEAN